MTSFGTIRVQFQGVIPDDQGAVGVVAVHPGQEGRINGMVYGFSVPAVFVTWDAPSLPPFPTTQAGWDAVYGKMIREENPVASGWGRTVRFVDHELGVALVYGTTGYETVALSTIVGVDGHEAKPTAAADLLGEPGTIGVSPGDIADSGGLVVDSDGNAWRIRRTPDGENRAVRQAVIDHLLGLAWNWDTHGAPPITPAAIDVLTALSVVPTVNGGIQFEWHCNGEDVELEVNSRGRVTSLLVDAADQEPTG